MLSGVWHTSFTVRDIEQSVAFYEGILGMEVVHRQEQANEYTSRLVGFPNAHLKVVMLKFPGQMAGPSGHVLELIEYVNPAGTPADVRTCNPGAAHLAFVVEDLAKAYADCKARSVQFKSEPVAITAGRNNGGCSVYFLDPDGITLEMVQPPALVLAQ